jgi:hypothetical protein
MRRLAVASASMLVALAIAALAAPAAAQETLPSPPHGFQPPPPPPVKPYKAVAVTPPQPLGDAGFDAFRKALSAVAEHKDLGALAKLVVARGFFWIQDKDVADPNKSGVENLAKAIALDGGDAAGWDILANEAADPTAAELPQNKGLFCAPAPPRFDLEAVQALLQQTDTDPTDWGYPLDDHTDARAAPAPDAPAVERLGMNLVRVLPDNPPPAPGAPAFLRVALPSGKTGFIAADSIAPLVTDQICYVKDAGGWKIAGYIGGASP